MHLHHDLRKVDGSAFKQHDKGLTGTGTPSNNLRIFLEGYWDRSHLWLTFSGVRLGCLEKLLHNKALLLGFVLDRRHVPEAPH